MNVVRLYRLDEVIHPQAMACRACEVRRTALFGALDERALDDIHESIANLELAPDDRLYDAGASDDWLYTIREGIVRLERSTDAGERRIVRLVGRGDLLGQESLLGRRHADDAFACTPVSLCRIPRRLVGTLSEHQAMVDELMQRWQTALDDAQAWVTQLTTGAAARRMLHLLVKLDEHTDEQGLIWLPRREDMGAMLDMTVETASRLVSRYKREGLLELHPPRHARLDRAKLRQALDESAAAA
jgi:CRP-like cAMP-binding protein